MTAIDLDTYAQGVLDGRRAVVARAITLVESTRPAHLAPAQELLTRLLPHNGRARRIGVSGVPGVGKSTFVDAFGTRLTGLGHRVGVLAVDPSSRRTVGRSGAPVQRSLGLHPPFPHRGDAGRGGQVDR